MQRLKVNCVFDVEMLYLKSKIQLIQAVSTCNIMGD